MRDTRIGSDLYREHSVSESIRNGKIRNGKNTSGKSVTGKRKRELRIGNAVSETPHQTTPYRTNVDREILYRKVRIGQIENSVSEKPYQIIPYRRNQYRKNLYRKVPNLKILHRKKN